MAIRSFVGLGVVVTGFGMAACTLASPTYITASQDPSLNESDAAAATSSSGGASAPSGGSSSGGGGTCGTDDYTKPDVSKLTACGGGKGHCFAKSKSPIVDQLVACADPSQVCVPDEILAAGGQKLKSCTTIIPGPGGCINAALLPEIAKQGGSVLKQDVCDPGLTCVPCTDPIHGNVPTPFCQPIGVHEKDCAAGGGAGGDAGAPTKPLEACCTTNGKSNGVCITETTIPEKQRSQAPADTCSAGNKCVPAAFVAGTPVKCNGGIMGAGVCMDKCFNSMMSLAGSIGFLSSDGCGSTELCIPCQLVSGQGVPGCQ